MSKLELKAFISETAEPVVTDQATKRIVKILDANYQKADLKVVPQKSIHLNARERERERCCMNYSSNIRTYLMGA